MLDLLFEAVFDLNRAPELNKSISLTVENRKIETDVAIPIHHFNSTSGKTFGSNFGSKKKFKKVLKNDSQSAGLLLALAITLGVVIVDNAIFAITKTMEALVS
uniref:Uncharacterized protein n=1 Tax=Glossina palpalis gambiensis TaxID=67801 RepID=A0A1B0B2S9_9MUSC